MPPWKHVRGRQKSEVEHRPAVNIAGEKTGCSGTLGLLKTPSEETRRAFLLLKMLEKSQKFLPDTSSQRRGNSGFRETLDSLTTSWGGISSCSGGRAGQLIRSTSIRTASAPKRSPSSRRTDSEGARYSAMGRLWKVTMPISSGTVRPVPCSACKRPQAARLSLQRKAWGRSSSPRQAEMTCRAPAGVPSVGKTRGGIPAGRD